MSDTNVERRRIAAEYLLRSRDDVERAERVRAGYIVTARTHGLTDTDISSYLGVPVEQLDTIARTGGA